MSVERRCGVRVKREGEAGRAYWVERGGTRVRVEMLERVERAGEASVGGAAAGPSGGGVAAG